MLSGVFSDDTGDHPAGCYLRNPPGSAHRPSSTTGAVIFVKLGQMQPLESTARRIDTHQPANWSGEGEHAVCSLYSDPFEHVWLQRMPPGQPMGVAPTAGIELLVLDGALRDGSQQHGRGTWLRFPERLTPALHAGRAGAVVWVKATPTGASAS